MCCGPVVGMGGAMRSIIACGLILLGLNGTAQESEQQPEYGASFSQRFASAADTSAASYIDSSTGRSDRLTVASLAPRALALEIFRPTAADMQLRLASANPDFNTAMLSSDNREASLDDL